MAARIKWTPERIDVVRKLAAEGLTTKEIAARTGNNYNSIRDLKRTAGIVFPSFYLSWKPEVCLEIEKQMKAGLTHREIGEKLGIPYYTVQNISKRKIRDPLTYKEKIARILAKNKRLAPRREVKQVYLATIQENDLIRQIKSMLKGSFFPWLKEDIIQEAALRVLEGETLDKNLIRSTITRIMDSGRYKEISLDAPYHKDGRTLRDTLPDHSSFDPSD